MTEPLPSNKHPLNQACKRLMLRDGQAPSPTYPYAVQLMQWGLDGNALEIKESVRAGLLDEVAALLRDNERTGRRVLFLLGETPDERQIVPSELEAMPIAEAAMTLLVTMHGMLVEAKPGYSVSPE